MPNGFKAILVAVALVASATGSAGAGCRQCSRERERVNQSAIFRFAAAYYALDPDLLEAIASVESGGNASAVSPKGAQGVMQIMPATGERLGLRDPFDPVQNILAAARFLSYLRWWQLGRPWSPADLPEVLAAYNAGPGAVQKSGGIPPYPETEEYVRKVLVRYLFGKTPPAGLVPRAKVAPPDGERSGNAVGATARPATDALDQLSEIRRLRAQAERRPLPRFFP